MEILDAKDLTFTYAGSEKPALENITLSVKAGEFVCVAGPTGSGKSTLLRMFKEEIRPAGKLSGEIFLCGKNINQIDGRESAEKIAFVSQRPEDQIVTDRVGAELSFCPENLGIKEADAMPKIAETAELFGLDGLFDAETSKLSGGEKQLLCLAASITASPEIVLLDEPTSRLDPAAAEKFASVLSRLNRRDGVTVIVAEHNVSHVLQYADKLAVIEDGRLVSYGEPSEVLSKKPSDATLSDMPASVRLFYRTGIGGVCPVSVYEGRKAFENTDFEPDNDPEINSSDPALEFDRVFFRYERDMPDVLRNVKLTVNKGEIAFLSGGNGSGKSTLLKCAAGLLRPYSGNIKLFSENIKKIGEQRLYNGLVGYLSQDVYSVFTRDTVGAEFKGVDISKLPCDISGLFGRHPFDLSGGELQLTALCRVLCLDPKLILLDEPTKGLDAETKGKFTKIIKGLAENGAAVLIVSHDTELMAECADKCAMIFRGEIISVLPAASFLRNNRLYTTDFCRMTGGKLIK